MVPIASDFLIHTGDFVENGASLAQWQSFFDIESPLLGGRCLFAAVGNHELTDKAAGRNVALVGRGAKSHQRFGVEVNVQTIIGTRLAQPRDIPLEEGGFELVVPL